MSHDRLSEFMNNAVKINGTISLCYVSMCISGNLINLFDFKTIFNHDVHRLAHKFGGTSLFLSGTVFYYNWFNNLN